MGYEFTDNLTEARRRLEDARRIPEWPISPEYANLMRAENTASSVRCIMAELSGVLFSEAYGKAVLGGPEAMAADLLSQAKLRLVQARQNVVNLRIVRGVLRAHAVLPADIIQGITGQHGEDVGAAQQEQFERAAATGWDFTYVDAHVFRRRVRRLGSRFASSFCYLDTAGVLTATYVQASHTGPSVPHEYWYTDTKRAHPYHQAFLELRATKYPTGPAEPDTYA